MQNYSRSKIAKDPREFIDNTAEETVLDVLVCNLDPELAQEVRLEPNKFTAGNLLGTGRED